MGVFIRIVELHDGAALRWFAYGPIGLVEQRMSALCSALVFHRTGCEGFDCDEDCDAEITPGQSIAHEWRMSGCDDAVVRDQLEIRYRKQMAAEGVAG